MSKRLEDFMDEHREAFDDLQPRADIWDNISKELDAWDKQQAPKKREAKTFSLGFVLRVAAMIVVVMGIGFGIYIQSQKTGKQGVDLAEINPIYAKQQMHLVSLIETKKTELKQVAKMDPELYNEFNSELVKMQANYKKLSTDLATSPNQERVLRAMIRNLQIQTEVLNQQLSVIEQIDQSKKQQQNGTKDI
jgi:DNA-directed RNA polymerase subunit F